MYEFLYTVVWGERAEERCQEVKLGLACWMGQIFVAILAGICSEEAGQLLQWIDWQIISDVATEERSHRVPSKSAAWGGDLKCHPLLYITCYVDSLPLTYLTQTAYR